jgi:hypothetical protein
MTFKYVQATRELKAEAWGHAKALGNLNGSITKGKGNITGMMGEVIIHHLYPTWEWAPTHDYDFKTPDGRTIDVKSKSTRFKPKEHFECSIASWNTRQLCDVYLFTRIHFDRDDVDRKDKVLGAWILGWMPKEKYMRKAKFIREGTYDKSNNWICPHTCYNLQIGHLFRMDYLV